MSSQVGNQAWVTWLDSNVPDLTRINNKVTLFTTIYPDASDLFGFRMTLSRLCLP
jgi:hypothetical protein